MKKTARVKFRHACCRILVGEKAVLHPGMREGFWRIAWAEGVGALIWHKVSMKRDVLPAAEALRTCIERPLRIQTARALMLGRINAMLLQHMRQSGITCMILRGQGLAETLYHPAVLRPQTDIDLLVDECDLAAVTQIVIRAGFGLVEHHPLLFIRESILLDLHIDPLDMERVPARTHLTPMRTRDFFSHAEPGRLAGGPALFPHPRINLPYLCFHAMKHSFDRLIWLWDIALLSRNIQKEDQWHAVLEGIREYRLERPCFYALSYVRMHLDAPVPREMLEVIQPKMGLREQSMYARFMRHEVTPFLAERLFARMMPDFRHRMLFWKEAIVPRGQVRARISGEGCVQCGFIRKRLKQLIKALWMLVKETWAMLRLPD